MKYFILPSHKGYVITTELKNISKAIAVCYILNDAKIVCDALNRPISLKEASWYQQGWDARSAELPTEEEIEDALIEWLGYDNIFSRRNANQISKIMRQLTEAKK